MKAQSKEIRLIHFQTNHNREKRKDTSKIVSQGDFAIRTRKITDSYKSGQNLEKFTHCKDNVLSKKAQSHQTQQNNRKSHKKGDLGHQRR